MQALLLNLSISVVSLLLGIATTHVYHRKGTRELRAIVDKLPSKVADALQADVRSKLSVEELNQLIYEKTVDEEAGRAGEPLPYRACPKCGSGTLSRSTVEGRGGHVYYIISCQDCGWFEYSE